MSIHYFFVSFAEFLPQALCDKQPMGLELKRVILLFTVLFQRPLIQAALAFSGLHSKLQWWRAKGVQFSNSSVLSTLPAGAQLSILSHEIIESQNIPSWKVHIKVTGSNSWFHTAPLKNHTILLRALSRHLLCSGKINAMICPEETIPCPHPPSEKPFPSTQPDVPLVSGYITLHYALLAKLCAGAFSSTPACIPPWHPSQEQWVNGAVYLGKDKA